MYTPEVLRGGVNDKSKDSDVGDHSYGYCAGGGKFIDQSSKIGG
jgi:hypothetical protein